MNEKYAGINGRIQGDKNDSRPAANAAGNVTVAVNTKTILWLNLGFVIDSSMAN